MSYLCCKKQGEVGLILVCAVVRIGRICPLPGVLRPIDRQLGVEDVRPVSPVLQSN